LSEDVGFADDVTKHLIKLGTPSWVFTSDVYAGDNWREVQVRAMLTVSAHIVILSERLVESDYIKIELLLSESRNLPLYTILPSRLQGEKAKIDVIMRSYNRF